VRKRITRSAALSPRHGEGAPNVLPGRSERMLHRLIGLLILAISLAAGWLWTDYQAFTQTPLSVGENGLVYELKPGGSARSLARDLHAQGVLRNEIYFRILARIDADARHLKAGEYLIEPLTTPAGLLRLLSSGKVIQHSITLIEGLNIRQMLAAIAADERLLHTLKDKSAADLMAALGKPDRHPEGRFLPDTYFFSKGSADIDIMRRAMTAMDELLLREWPQRDADLPLSSAEEVLILASIVEKETGLATERPRIAGVFVRRLERGMKLQTDPSVIYGMGEAYDGNIRRADLRRDTPYNTYTRTGLPPTPIAMPGADAIRAVLHPAAEESLYFVAKGDGSHYFSSSLAEHNKAVRKYQLKK
jgi:UPF0755 protein